MKLPIFALGHSILKETCENIAPDFPDLNLFIRNMWETMQNAYGCGLAAPQVGHALRLFIVDSKSTYENLDESDRNIYFEDNDKGIMETFINPTIIQYSKDYWEDSEGCLSIPDMSQSVKRPWTITLEYYNELFEKQTRTFGGTTARIIQHEYDHTNGILYINHLKPLTRRLIDAKLRRIARGQIPAKYPMRFAT